MLAYGKQGKYKDYKKVAELEKSRAKKGFIFLGEYECFYLYEKLGDNGERLYRETFSKFDIDGVPPQRVPRGANVGKTHRGEML